MKTIDLKSYDGVISSYATKQVNLLDTANNPVPFVDTSDANATENSIGVGKVGYVNGQKVTGTRGDLVDVQGVIAAYEVDAGANINAGDFVTFVNKGLSYENSCCLAPSAILLDTNKVFIAHSYSPDYYLYGTIVTIDGTTMTAVTTQLDTAVNSCDAPPSAILLDTNKVFIAHAYSANYYLYGTIVTIDGTTMTPVNTQLSAVVHSCYNMAPSAILLEPNKVFIGHAYGSNYYLYSTIVTIDGTTMTAVTTQLSAVANSCYRDPSAILLDTNKVFIAHSYSTNRYLYGTIVTVDGSTMTPVTTQLSAVTYSCRYAPSAVLLEANKVFIAHSYSSNYYLYSTIVTIDGTTMTPVTTQLSAVTNSCYMVPSAILLSSNKVFIAHAYSSNYYLYGTIVTIDGTTMTAATTQLSTVTSSCYMAPSAILLDTNKVFIAHSYSTGRYLTGALATISNGAIDTITIIIPRTIARPYLATINGIAYTSGAPGDTINVKKPS